MCWLLKKFDDKMSLKKVRKFQFWWEKSVNFTIWPKNCIPGDDQGFIWLPQKNLEMTSGYEFHITFHSGFGFRRRGSPKQQNWQPFLVSYRRLLSLRQPSWISRSLRPQGSSVASKTLCTRLNHNYCFKFDVTWWGYPQGMSEEKIRFWIMWPSFQGHQGPKGHKLKPFLCTW